MNKIKQWVNPKEYLPRVQELVLLKMKRVSYMYRFARAEIYEDNFQFLDEVDGDGSYQLEEVEAWCYAKLDEVEF